MVYIDLGLLDYHWNSLQFMVGVKEDDLDRFVVLFRVPSSSSSLKNWQALTEFDHRYISGQDATNYLAAMRQADMTYIMWWVERKLGWWT